MGERETTDHDSASKLDDSPSFRIKVSADVKKYMDLTASKFSADVKQKLWISSCRNLPKFV
jgi:hypothetical protein